MNNLKKYRVPLLGMLLCTAIAGCTDGFEKINTDPNGVDESVASMIDKIQNPLNNLIPPQEHRYQGWANLTTDIFAGFMMGVNDFGGSNNYNYLLRPDHSGQTYCDFYLYVFKYSSQYIPQCKELGRNELAAMMQIGNVCAILPVVSSYGPTQYASVKEKSNTYYYDSEENIYKALFADLKEAVQWLEEFQASNPSDELLQEFKTADKVCDGNVGKWIRLANTMRLRIAMQLVKVAPDMAKEEAEAAVKAGVLTSGDTDVVLKSGLRLALIEDLWNDTRASANIISILKGYKDPRLEHWFVPNGEEIYDAADENKVALEKNAEYIGVRTGVPMTRTEYQGYSKTNRKAGIPDHATRPLMRVAEAYFLRAEGDLRGWNMNGKAKNLYNDGIRAAFNSILGADKGDVDNYIEGIVQSEDFDWDKFEGGFGSAPFINYRNRKYDYYMEEEGKKVGINRVSIKWHDKDDNEKKLQRIITQKWIALFPTMSAVAWTEFRRTGYPKLIPIPDELNKSNGEIDTDIQIRRLPFTQGEYNSNLEEVTKALLLLKGPDNGGTRLWWDVDTNGTNF